MRSTPSLPRPQPNPLSPAPQGRRGWLALCLGGALALTACAAGGAPFVAKTVDVSEAQLLQTLANTFPITRRVGDVLELRLTDPALRFLPESNRLATAPTVTASVDVPMLGRSARSYPLVASYGLRYQASDGTVRLQDWRWENLPTMQLPAMVQGPFNRWTQTFADGLLRDHVVYRLSDTERAKLDTLGLQPVMQVQPRGLRIVLVRR